MFVLRGCGLDRHGNEKEENEEAFFSSPLLVSKDLLGTQKNVLLLLTFVGTEKSKQDKCFGQRQDTCVPAVLRGGGRRRKLSIADLVYFLFCLLVGLFF